MELIKIKKDKKSNDKVFIVHMSESEYIRANNFLTNNKDGLVYLGDGRWADPDVIKHDKVKNDSDSISAFPADDGLFAIPKKNNDNTIALDHSILNIPKVTSSVEE